MNAILNQHTMGICAIIIAPMILCALLPALRRRWRIVVSTAVFSGSAAKRASTLSLLDRKMLAPNVHLGVVEFAGKHLLLGSSAGTLVVLAGERSRLVQRRAARSSRPPNFSRPNSSRPDSNGTVGLEAQSADPLEQQ